jgi:hypothetical protein
MSKKKLKKGDRIIYINPTGEEIQPNDYGIVEEVCRHGIRIRYIGYCEGEAVLTRSDCVVSIDYVNKLLEKAIFE